MALVLLSNLLTTLLKAGLIMLGTAGLRQLCSRLDMPRPPWRLVSAAVMLWLLEQLLGVLLPIWHRQWQLHLVSQYLGLTAVLQLIVWLAIDSPARLGLLPPSPRIVKDLLVAVVWVVATGVFLHQKAHVNMLGLFTTSALLTAILGFAAQEPLRDLLSGLMLQLDPPFHVDDWIQVEGTSGQVIALSWRSVCVRLLDTSVVVLPNSEVTRQRVQNHTYLGLRSGNRFLLGLSYDLAPGTAIDLIRRMVISHPDVIPDRAPIVRVHEYGESSLTYEVILWQRDHSHTLEIRAAVLRQLWYALGRIGQSIPYPVRDVRVRNLDSGIAATSSFGEVDPAIPPSTRWWDEETERRLAAQPVLCELPAQARHQLLALGNRESYGEGELIYRQGDEGRDLIVVLDGTLNVQVRGPDGVEHDLGQAGNPGLFGEIALLASLPRQLSLRCATDATVLRIDGDLIMGVLRPHGAAIEALAALMAERQSLIDAACSQPSRHTSLTFLERLRKRLGIS
jgi:small-conductance mechanosensitive channel/CRP-like cAMP-binding protein